MVNFEPNISGGENRGSDRIWNSKVFWSAPLGMAVHEFLTVNASPYMRVRPSRGLRHSVLHPWWTFTLGSGAIRIAAIAARHLTCGRDSIAPHQNASLTRRCPGETRPT